MRKLKNIIKTIAANNIFIRVLLGWLFPGLGHYAIGQPKRGLRLGLGIWFLIVIGILIAGTSAIDQTRDHIIFIAQLGIGPAAYIINIAGIMLRNNADQTLHNSMVAIGHLHHIGSLSVALGGLLNIIALIDVSKASQNYDLIAEKVK